MLPREILIRRRCCASSERLRAAECYPDSGTEGGASKRAANEVAEETGFALSVHQYGKESACA